MLFRSRMEICVTAPAKINIGLHVLPGCVNGFHRIESIFQTVTLFDTLVVLASEKNGCVVDYEGMELPSDNTISLSYTAFRSVTGIDNFGIHVADLLVQHSPQEMVRVELALHVDVGALCGNLADGLFDVLRFEAFQGD